METLEFTVSVRKDDLLEFLNDHALNGVDVFGQLPEDESIQVDIKMRDRYGDIEFELSYEAKMADIEHGQASSHDEINDFKRCHNSTCHWGFFVSATSKTPLVKCPRCGNVQDRKTGENISLQ